MTVSLPTLLSSFCSHFFHSASNYVYTTNLSISHIYRYIYTSKYPDQPLLEAQVCIWAIHFLIPKESKKSPVCNLGKQPKRKLRRRVHHLVSFSFRKAHQSYLSTYVARIHMHVCVCVRLLFNRTSDKQVCWRNRLSRLLAILVSIFSPTHHAPQYSHSSLVIRHVQVD